jgi:hypothetical protein
MPSRHTYIRVHKERNHVDHASVGIAMLLDTYLADEKLHMNTWLGAIIIMLVLLANQQQQVRHVILSPAKLSLKKA